MRTLSRIRCFRVNDPLTVSERFDARLVYLSLRYQIDSYRLVTRRHCLEKKEMSWLSTFSSSFPAAILNKTRKETSHFCQLI